MSSEATMNAEAGLPETAAPASMSTVIKGVSIRESTFRYQGQRLRCFVGVDANGRVPCLNLDTGRWHLLQESYLTPDLDAIEAQRRAKGVTLPCHGLPHPHGISGGDNRTVPAEIEGVAKLYTVGQEYRMRRMQEV
jgi:hypothetical protein